MELTAWLFISLALVSSIYGDQQAQESSEHAIKERSNRSPKVNQCRRADDAVASSAEKKTTKSCLPSGLRRFSCSTGEECCRAPPRSVPPYRCQGIRDFVGSSSFTVFGPHGPSGMALALSQYGPEAGVSLNGYPDIMLSLKTEYHGFFMQDETYTESHVHCIVVDKDTPMLRYYVDVVGSAVMEEVGTGSGTFQLPPTLSVSPFRRYDTVSSELLNFNGGGKVSYLEVWNGAMTLEQLNSLGCEDTGDLLSWTDPDAFTVVGDPVVSDAECPFSA